MLHEFGGVASLPAGIRVLKHLADVGKGEGAKDGIDEGVVDDIAVGVGKDAKLGFVDGVGRSGVGSFFVGPLCFRRKRRFFVRWDAVDIRYR